MNGKMIWFNPAKQHGYLWTEDGERLLVESSDLAPGCRLPERCRDLPVTFDREESGAQGPHAVHVAVAPLQAARRARMRGRR